MSSHQTEQAPTNHPTSYTPTPPPHRASTRMSRTMVDGHRSVCPSHSDDQGNPHLPACHRSDVPEVNSTDSRRERPSSRFLDFLRLSHRPQEIAHHNPYFTEQHVPLEHEMREDMHKDARTMASAGHRPSATDQRSGGLMHPILSNSPPFDLFSLFDPIEENSFNPPQSTYNGSLSHDAETSYRPRPNFSTQVDGENDEDGGYPNSSSSESEDGNEQGRGISRAQARHLPYDNGSHPNWTRLDMPSYEKNDDSDSQALYLDGRRFIPAPPWIDSAYFSKSNTGQSATSNKDAGRNSESQGPQSVPHNHTLQMDRFPHHQGPGVPSVSDYNAPSDEMGMGMGHPRVVHPASLQGSSQDVSTEVSDSPRGTNCALRDAPYARPPPHVPRAPGGTLWTKETDLDALLCGLNGCTYVYTAAGLLSTTVYAHLGTSHKAHLKPGLWSRVHCPYEGCMKHYANVAGLKCHVYKGHVARFLRTENQYLSETCGKSFTGMERWEVHMETKHRKVDR